MLVKFNAEDENGDYCAIWIQNTRIVDLKASKIPNFRLWSESYSMGRIQQNLLLYQFYRYKYDAVTDCFAL